MFDLPTDRADKKGGKPLLCLRAGNRLCCFRRPSAISWDFRMKFLQEMSLAAEAVYRVYQPEKMNYELLGNGDTHLHWHLFPRVTGDTPQKGPVWWLPKEEMWDEQFRPTPQQLREQTERLRAEIAKVYLQNGIAFPTGQK